ncbi:uncharacterized protein LOC123872741 isoform X1 [Maniola jurtina]|uniref:uncharacterized protein LOC123872741 isoform X1 n=1 Tax=Maniola jurtina TaxID=191418 RepID=UPI001E68C340|nr:uncharacterized protein LOC123872741 isoform X1 [Maniola jurtina]
MTVRACTFLLLIAFAHAFIDEAVDVIKLGKEIGEEVLNSWDLLGKPLNISGGVDLPVIKRRERIVLAKLDRISRMIERLELGIEKNSAVAMLLAKTGRGARLELRLHEMADLLSRVASADRQMREYVRLQKELERTTLEDFAQWCVSHDPGALPGLLERVHALIAPPHKHLLGRGILNLVLDDLQEEHPDLCELQLSPHQLIYDMYNTISLTEIKGYAMMQFSWMLLRIYGKGNFTQEASLTRQRYGERTSRTAAAARAALAMARRDLYRCDPPQHKLGETYEEVTRLLQGYIENEVDMNSDNTCRENCAYYTLAEHHTCFKEQFCAQQAVCKGRIIDCNYIDSDMWVCRAGKNSNRRYEWIEYENGRTLGKPGSCPRGTTKVDSWWRWLFWHCSYCMCLCDEPGPESHRYFSLWDATSDVKNNKVVTGLRLVKHGRVFHLQISEGTLGERGSITPGSWVPLQKFDITDSGIRDGIDYHTMSYEKRAIDLDELDSPTGYILTGVRFRMIGAHLHFEIRSTPFNYTTGRLSPARSQWISNDNTEGAEVPRSRLELFRPDIPTRSATPLPVDSKHDQYLEFTHSDFEADAAQSTVPFVDIQPLEPMKGSALISGAGIIHRGTRGSGGFIAAKLFTYNYSRHIKAESPPAFVEADVEKDLVLPVSNF